MFILQVFLVRGAVFHADAFAFQLVKGGVRAFFGNHHRRVGVVRVGKGDLLATLWRDVHTGNHRVVFFEFQRRDQAVKRVVGEGAVGLHLLTQRFGEVDIETDDLVAGIQRLKRRICCRYAEVDFVCCRCASGEGCQ
ncbi:hypothetical protein D3C85_1293310 [compost metagenome]